MIQEQATQISLDAITAFDRKLDLPLTKQSISVLQVNLGKRCNLACSHCHVEASPNRTEEFTPEITDRTIALIHKFPQLKIVDLTGGAPEMLYGFKPIVEAARSEQKEVIVRSNLTIYFVPGYEDMPAYCARHQVRIVASLPCYLADNVDRMRGKGVYDDSIRAIQWLNQLGYGRDPNLILDLVYNSPLPTAEQFSLAPSQIQLERDYKTFLAAHFEIDFNHLLTITNLPMGRTKSSLEHRNLHIPYLHFLESHFNASTIERLMCRNQLSIDYLGNVYDCDFNQMENLPARYRDRPLVLTDLLEAGTLDLINEIQTAPYCYGCTAGSGSSCGGTLV